MKIKTIELTGAALDWAVAACEEKIEKRRDNLYRFPFLVAHAKYSTDWAQGGPIIERAEISLAKLEATIPDAMAPHPACWSGNIDGSYVRYAPTPLIAAMRCYVASKLGEEVDIPDELVLPGADAA